MTIEHRQTELEAIHAEVFGDRLNNVHSKQPLSATAGVSLDDQKLLDKAMNAANGDKFRRLWEGDISDYPSHSEADLALCYLLAFWTGGDTIKMDKLFRQSGLYRRSGVNSMGRIPTGP
jgi:primase-polymerase (primpol)-like protein